MKQKNDKNYNQGRKIQEDTSRHFKTKNKEWRGNRWFSEGQAETQDYELKIMKSKWSHCDVTEPGWGHSEQNKARGILCVVNSTYKSDLFIKITMCT